jgi:HSP20 family protein
MLTSTWVPDCDVFESRDAVKIVAEVSGMRPEDVKLSLENNLLTLKGEKQAPPEDANARKLRAERTYGRFERVFSLSSAVDSERIAASYDNGVLTISIPKAERARPREIAVKVS